MIQWVIYKTTCVVTNKIYIGQHKTQNIDDGYLGSGKLIRRAIEKYGPESFVREILSIEESFEQARISEETQIRMHNSTDRNVGYNISKYAWGGQPITEESRRKISVKLTGRVLSEATKDKMKKPKEPFSDSHRKNMSLSRAGKFWYCNPQTQESKQYRDVVEVPAGWIKGRISSHMAGTRTGESRAKQSAKLKNKPKSEEHKKKLKEAARLYYEKISNIQASK